MSSLLCVYILISAVAEVRTREYTVCFVGVKEFNKWIYSNNYLIELPINATNINAMACPGSDIYNVDYCIMKDEFILYINKLGISSPIIYSSFSVCPFHRTGNYKEINSGYCIDYTKQKPAIINICYDVAISQVLYRQSGRYRPN